MADAYNLTTGRTLGIKFNHGEDFFTGLREVCRANGVKHGYVPMFIAGFSEVDVVGACDKIENLDAPVWSKVHLTAVEAVGAGTIAYDPESDQIVPHIHVSAGLKERSATGHTSHLLNGTVQFLVEMVIVEVTAPQMTRPRNPDLYDVPLLTFATDS